MEENAALRTVQSSIEALGRGFDVNYDTRLLYCKGVAGSSLVEVDEEHTRDLVVSDGLVVPNVSRDVRCSRESGGRESTGACGFYENCSRYDAVEENAQPMINSKAGSFSKWKHHASEVIYDFIKHHDERSLTEIFKRVKLFYNMAEYFNRKAHLLGNSPIGSFNSVFSFTGSKKIDAVATKSLAMEGMFIPLCKVHLIKQPLSLREEVRHAVPLSWEPASLARFIERYGTHVITSITIGGKDVIYVKQHSLSPLSLMEIKNYIQDIGDHRFSETEGFTSSGPLKLKDKAVDSFAFNSQGIYPQPPSAPYLTAKEDVTVIFRRRGGDDLVQSYTKWARTVYSAPDVIEITFCPITSLLESIPGKDHLTCAIDLYLEYKPPIEELRYFLEFQVPRIWAPVCNELPGHQRKEPVCPYLQFSIMGPKLHVIQEQVSVGRKPVTGLRLCLKGAKQNRLCIQVQHLASLPKILQPYWNTHVAIGAPKWQGPEEQDSRWFEHVKWKNFSHVCTAPIENNETFLGDISGAYIVTGAQLGVWDFGSKNVLYMKLLYCKVPGCTIRRSMWDQNPSSPNDKSRRPSVGDSTDSVDSSSGSRDLGKLMKLVDMSEMSKGPDEIPGHWLVTGGKLGVEKGKIILRVKYSLLNY